MTRDAHDSAFDRPQVSVIMATFNGEAYIRQAIASIRAQTLTAWELIIVDDCSTDSTPSILRAQTDPRIRVLRNERNCGVVQSRNRAFAHVTAEYTAFLDHDDLSLPQRLARQIHYLQSHPETVLIGTASHTLEARRMGPPRHAGATSQALIGWLLLVANPLVCSSIMLRTDAARGLGEFMRADYLYADDFDLYHRMAQSGQIARLDETLTIYRLHGENASRRHEDIMTDAAARALAPAYARWLPDEDAAEAATLVIRHFATCRPVGDIATQRKLRHLLCTLADRYISQTPILPGDAHAIRNQAEQFWQRLIASSPPLKGSTRADYMSLIGSTPEAAGARLRRQFNRFPAAAEARAALRRVLAPPAPKTTMAPLTVCGETYLPLQPDAADPPKLYVVIDCAPNAAAGAIRAVLGSYGVNPVWLLNDTALRHTPLMTALTQGSSATGAFGVVLGDGSGRAQDARGSRAGALDTLTRAFETLIGAPPLFFRADINRANPPLPRAAQECGYRVDFSALPPSVAKPSPFRIGKASCFRIAGLPYFAALPVNGRATASMTGSRTDDVLLHLQLPADPARLDALCREFFYDAGGMPGDPQDLLARAT